MRKKKELKLTIEMVPEPCWEQNLRNFLGMARWRRIRYDVLYKAGNECQLCGQTEGMLHTHEIWKYDDLNYVQILIGFIALCEMCHYIKHIGFANTQVLAGKLDMEELIKHFCKVNKCKEETFFKHFEHMVTQNELRKRHSWTTNFVEFLPKPSTGPKRTVYIKGLPKK
jgi:hypothetical protein